MDLFVDAVEIIFPLFVTVVLFSSYGRDKYILVFEKKSFDFLIYSGADTFGTLFQFLESPRI